MGRNLGDPPRTAAFRSERTILSNSRYSYANPAAERANRPATRRGPPYVPRGEPSEMPRSHRRVPVPEATGLLRLAGPSGQPRPRPMARGQTLETTLARGPPPDKLAAHRGLESLAPEQTSRKKEQREKGNPGSQLPIIGAPCSPLIGGGGFAVVSAGVGYAT